MTLIIDEESLERTARVLEVINPGRASADSIRRHILNTEWSGYISTAGWVAYTWGDNNVRVSVEPYGVLKHLGLPTG